MDPGELIGAPDTSDATETQTLYAATNCEVLLKRGGHVIVMGVM